MSKMYDGYRDESKAFFDTIMEGLNGEVDEGSFWDAVAEDAVFEFCYDIPGFTNKFEGREAYKEWFMEYSIHLHKVDNLAVYKILDQNTIILEYEVHGTRENSTKQYDNKFCSIITIENRKITHWRDYMDTLAAMIFNS